MIETLCIICGQYVFSRCPFIMTFKKFLADQSNPFVLKSYRSEHNHLLNLTQRYYDPRGKKLLALKQETGGVTMTPDMDQLIAECRG